MPTVSIIMNCYNGEKYLKQAIDSIYAQSYENWEIIFWDNCSSDNSANIAKSFDHKLKYFRSESTTTLGEARQKACEVTQGEWLAFLDVDDYWYPYKLQKQMDVLYETDHLLCYAGVKEVTPDNKLIRNVLPLYRTGMMLEEQLKQYDINMVTPLISKTALAKYKLSFDPNIKASEEYNLFTRLAAKGTIAAIPEILAVYRVYDGSLTDQKISSWADERFYTLDQIKSENPEIEKTYPEAFNIAYSRGLYYKAQYEYLINEISKAKDLMKKIASISIYYKVLYLSLFIPGLWGFIHKKIIKRKLLAIFEIANQYFPRKFHRFLSRRNYDL